MKMTVGDIIRHNKRGSEYEVVGKIHELVLNLVDGQELLLSTTDGGDWSLRERNYPYEIRLPVRYQTSLPRESAWVDVVLYRALVSKKGEPWLFARPLSEFTEDRFTKVPT